MSTETVWTRYINRCVPFEHIGDLEVSDDEIADLRDRAAKSLPEDQRLGDLISVGPWAPPVEAIMQKMAEATSFATRMQWLLMLDDSQPPLWVATFATEVRMTKGGDA